MRRIASILVVCGLFLSSCGAPKSGLEERGELYRGGDVMEFLDATAPPGVEEEYLIGVGDRLDVVFFVHKELSTPGLLVRTDGRITMPYVGDVRAAGLTPMQLDSTLSSLYSEVLRDPNLSVIVKEPAEKLVYVLGQVKRAGGFKFETRVSVLGAVALAGGLDEGAKTSHVLVIRRDGADRIVGAEINIAAATSGYNVANDIWLKNYDIVFVPKTRLKSAAEFVQLMNEILFPPVDIALRGWQVQVLRQQLEFLQSNN